MSCSPESSAPPSLEISAPKLAIRVQGVSKNYQIYEKPVDRLKQFVFPGVRRIFSLPSHDYYRSFFAVKDVSFEVARGETVGIIGRNGAGKSTLLQIICGTLSPSSGSLEVNGRVAALLELGAGFNPEFTGHENVYMNAGILGLSVKEIDARYDAILAFADIGDFINQPVKTYSSGMYVRLAFAVIANVDADILIIDEALAVGDIFFTQKCMRFLSNFKKTGTILFVTHDTNSVMSLCDRAIWLDAGVRRDYGESKVVCQSYLAEFYASVDPGSSTVFKSNIEQVTKKILDCRDARQDYINSSVLRNDLEIFRFSDEGEKFGTGQAHVLNVYLRALDDIPVSWFVGGELVEVVVTVRAEILLDKPIIGFLVKDKNGQHLFGENTYLTYLDDVLMIEEGVETSAVFKFRMPILPAGDYTLGVAVANGTQDNHVNHCWIHDALAFKSHSSSVSTGLLGLPMVSIEIHANE